MISKNNKQTLSTTKFNDLEFEDLVNITLSDAQYTYLSSNPFLSLKQIKYLFLKNIDNVNINLLRNKNCPEDKINDFLTHNDKIYNIAIAHNPSINKEIIQKLITFNDNDVNMSLEFNGYA